MTDIKNEKKRRELGVQVLHLKEQCHDTIDQDLSPERAIMKTRPIDIVIHTTNNIIINQAVATVKTTSNAIERERIVQGQSPDRDLSLGRDQYLVERVSQEKFDITIAPRIVKKYNQEIAIEY